MERRVSDFFDVKKLSPGLVRHVARAIHGFSLEEWKALDAATKKTHVLHAKKVLAAERNYHNRKSAAAG
jgi:hypothetical protein